MKREEIFEKLKDILISASDDEEKIKQSTEETKLQTELGMSSVDMLYTVIAIEETFDIRFDDVTVTSFVTVGDVVSYIEGKL
ncbi:MAG: acyl carrier protein [Clostridia bacterium]|nr:acyl carrier protein [Clostridia bacterium]